MPSIVKQIEKVECQVQKGEKRLDVIERRLRLFDMTDKERGKLEDEETSIQQSLVKNRSELRSLRFENFKTMVLSVVVMLFLYGIFYLYTSTSGSQIS